MEKTIEMTVPMSERMAEATYTMIPVPERPAVMAMPGQEAEDNGNVSKDTATDKTADTTVPAPERVVAPGHKEEDDIATSESKSMVMGKTADATIPTPEPDPTPNPPLRLPLQPHP